MQYQQPALISGEFALAKLCHQLQKLYKMAELSAETLCCREQILF
jgi:hypothetical protein